MNSTEPARRNERSLPVKTTRDTLCLVRGSELERSMRTSAYQDVSNDALGHQSPLQKFVVDLAKRCRLSDSSVVALGRDVEVEYLRLLVLQLLPNVCPALECWRWPIRLYTLGHFEVCNDYDAPRHERKGQRRPLTLAKALVALGGRDVPADKLIDILWPQPGEGDGQKAFDITVHRLRKLLGSDKAVQVTDRRATLNPKIVWVDVWVLERTLAPLIEAVNAPEPEIGLLEAAAPQVLNLYRGHFLASEPEEAWQIPIRNRLAGRFQRFALRLGEHWESRHLWRRALDLYARAVELDPMAESFYRRQMVCLHAQGQRAEAIEVFRRCRHMLSVTFGITPTSETEAVYRQLLAS